MEAQTRICHQRTDVDRFSSVHAHTRLGSPHGCSDYAPSAMADFDCLAHARRLRGTDQKACRRYVADLHILPAKFFFELRFDECDTALSAACLHVSIVGYHLLKSSEGYRFSGICEGESLRLFKP